MLHKALVGLYAYEEENTHTPFVVTMDEWNNGVRSTKSGLKVKAHSDHCLDRLS